MITRTKSLVFGALLLGTPSFGAAASFSDAYFFGDSLSDVGNLFAATSAVSPLPQPGDYFQGRFSNGPVFSERLYGSLGLGTLLPSFTGGTDYAVGGARARHHAVHVNESVFPPSVTPPLESDPTFAWTLAGQRVLFNANTLNGTNFDPDALYSVWHGANDLQDVLTLGAAASALQATDPTTAAALQSQATDLFITATTEVTGLIGELAGYGAQHLLVPNIPDLGKLPGVAGVPGAGVAATQQTASFNQQIDAFLATLASDVKVYRLDTFSLFVDLVDNPTDFGFTTADVPCFDGFVGVPGATCSDVTGYVFWDRVHPTTEVHGLIASESLALVPLPGAAVLLGSALTGLGVAGWRRPRVREGRV